MPMLPSLLGGPGPRREIQILPYFMIRFKSIEHQIMTRASFTFLGIASFFTIILLIISNCKTQEVTIEPRSMRILFLGHDSEHHNSAQFMPLLSAAMSPKGFHFIYTDDPDDLSAQTLEHYDALMLYANIDEISSSQEKALLQFVRAGGAFIPIHCASYCFRNSAAVVKLIGGQFASHDTATFQTQIVAAEHPAMQQVSEFSSWDETYVHTKLARDIEVLMERVEGDHREPYTWVKKYGRGRVFYTALGHDERTWKKPAFQGLIEQGVRWAIGDQKREALENYHLPTLEYTAAKIPNYEERDPPPMLQTPLSPDESQQYIQIPPDFELELFASEPDIINPIFMTWDERGRLWVLETKDYPNQIKKELGKGSDRIKILEDTDGDGRADKFTVFAENLSVPTSMVFSRGGVVVAQAPYFLFLQDTTGDDKADVMEVLIDGWGTSDTHAGPSNLRYGFDNQLWGVLGYSGFNGQVGEVQHEFSQGAYRFTPDGSALEFMGASSNNTWGLAFTEDFDVFLSTANNTHSAFLGIPHRYFEDVKGLKIKSVKKIDGHYHFHPNTANVRQVDVFGGFTAAAGHSFYTARDFPESYWNRIALVCEPTGHLLHRAIIEPSGAGYREKDGWNLLASADEWVSPVCAEVGPDGAVWILDWYNFIIQHNPTPPGFENGLGNAHINPLRDKQHGRIYRLSYKGAKHEVPKELSGEEPELLIDRLSHDNMRWRLHAQRLLVERDNPDVGLKVAKLIENNSVDALGLNVGAIHALWTLHGLGLINEDNGDILSMVYEALQHPSAAVRKNAIRVLPSDINSLVKMQEHGVFDDSKPSILLAAILSLGEMPSIEAVGDRLLTLSKQKRVSEDEWLARAVYAMAVKHRDVFTLALHQADQQKIAEGFEVEETVIDWSSPDTDVSDWKQIRTPDRWSKTKAEELHDFDGIVWTRTSFDLEKHTNTGSATLSLGPIDDSDDVYINGVLVGSSRRKWNAPRVYKVPAKVLKKGENIMVIKITDSGGRGGVFGEEEDVFLRLGSEVVNLSGIWLYQVEEQFFANRSVFAEGRTIENLFLEHYGPYAQQLSNEMALKEQLATQEITIKTMPDQMRYDPEQLSVTAGTTVKINFENNDGMQHNLLIGAPGSLELIGRAADNMAQKGFGADQEYIPELPQVLLAAGLVDPGEQRSLIWTVPNEPGTYIYVCTFPGHWQTMKGVIEVKALAL